MAGSGFMILCLQSPPQARLKMGEANLGTPPHSKAFQEQPQKANLGTPAQPQSISRISRKAFQKKRRKAFQKKTHHRQKPHTKKSLQSLTNLHKKVFIFAH